SAISSQANTGSSGKAGSVQVSVSNVANEASISNSALISSSTAGSGNAGTVTVTSASGTLGVHSGAAITSSTSGAGEAGTVTVSANKLIVDGSSNGVGSSISAAAASGSSGQTGDVTITAANSIELSNGATFSIKNDATPQSGTPTQKTLSVSAPQLTVNGGS